jgi:hypothetical protein
MNAAALVEEIEARVEGMPVRDAQALRALRREYSKRIAAVPARDVVKIAAALIVHRRVPRFIGDELVASRADALRAIDLSQLERLGSGMSGWDEVDCFSCYLSGPTWREGQIKDKAIEEWARSRNRWWRRAAPSQHGAVERKSQRWPRRCAAHAFDLQSPY